MKGFWREHVLPLAVMLLLAAVLFVVLTRCGP